ncbi:MAG: ATP-binding protein [bacterium]
MPEANVLHLEEREFLIWLRGIEKRAILPLKWVILLIAVVFWVLSHPNYYPPPVDVFALFTVYLMCALGESYFLWFSAISLTQTRRFCVVSYCLDVAFVTILIYLDARKYPAIDGPATDFYIFYFLLILRGFALFRTARENLLANSVIGVIFILTLLWQDTSLFTYSSRNTLIRIVFIWLVIMLSWFIVEIINRQKAEIMRARERLIRSENFVILGELAAGVAHEINNPIGIITAYAEFLKKNAPGDDPRRDDFDVILKESRRCKCIVEELLDYATPRPHSIEKTDLRAVNDEVLDFLFHHSSEDHVDVIRNYPSTLPLVGIDTNQFKQALLNVFLNARQSIEGRELPRFKVSIRDEERRGGIGLAYEDNGCGVSPAELKKVFDPFFTTRPGGTGLGLAITKRIVENHGGQISIDSTENAGTVVRIFLPYTTTSSG